MARTVLIPHSSSLDCWVVEIVQDAAAESPLSLSFIRGYIGPATLVAPMPAARRR